MDALFENKYHLPQGIVHAMLQDPILGVCVSFKDNRFKRWYSLGFSYSPYSLSKLSSLVKDGKYSDFERDFVVLDGDGNVCCTNCDVSVEKRDEMIIVDGKHYIKVIKDKSFPRYISGSSKMEIDKQEDILVRSKQIKRFR